MIQHILSELKHSVGGDLTGRLGLDQQNADGAINEAGATLQEMADNFEMSSLMEMLAGGGDGGMEEVPGKVEQDYMGRLTGKLELDPATAVRVKDMVLPALMNLMGTRGAEMLGPLLGGNTGGAGNDLAGKLSGLGKMFGK